MSSDVAEAATAEQVRDRVHQAWGAVAASWGRHADQVEQRSAPLNALMIEAVAPVPGDAVVELACGAGGLGLGIADRVAPGGRVVLSDVAPPMVAIAAARAAQVDADVEIDVRVLDLEGIDLPDASVDVVVCREGLMFALDPARAAGEITRVLRPGGRLAVAVWGPRERNPWLGVLADAVQEELGSPVPPPGVPGPFSLGAPGVLADVLAGAGLEQVQVEEVALPTHDASFADYWQLRTDLAGPLKSLLARLSTHQRDAVRETVRARLSQFETSAGLTIPGLSYLASARRPVTPASP